MSIITVEIARFGHAKKRSKVKVRRGMAWKVQLGCVIEAHYYLQIDRYL